MIDESERKRSRWSTRRRDTGGDVRFGVRRRALLSSVPARQLQRRARGQAHGPSAGTRTVARARRPAVGRCWRARRPADSRRASGRGLILPAGVPVILRGNGRDAAPSLSGCRSLSGCDCDATDPAIRCQCVRHCPEGRGRTTTPGTRRVVRNGRTQPMTTAVPVGRRDPHQGGHRDGVGSAGG